MERRTNWLIDQIGSKEKVEEYYNKTSTQIREMLRENIRDGKTVQKMQQQIVGDIKITPAEVRRYFKDLPQDSIPFIPTQVEVQIITMEPKIPQEEIERVKKTLRDYTERVTSGEIAFSTLARLYSEDEGSRRRGGELGFMGRAELVPEYANVAFNLQDPNKVSKIVESEFGFQQAIYRFFHTGDVPSHLMGYAPMFAWYEGGMQGEPGMLQPDGQKEVAGGKKSEKVPVVGKESFYQRIPIAVWSAGIAAMMVIALGLGFIFYSENQADGSGEWSCYEGSYVEVGGKRISDVKQIMPCIIETLEKPIG